MFLVYTGETNGVYKFIEIDSLEENNGITWQGFKICAFKKKLFAKGMSPGAIFPAEKEGSSYSFSSKDLPMALWKNQEDLIEARAQASANKEKKDILRELGINQLKERLKPIRDVYVCCNPNQKLMLLADVIKEVTGGR